MSVSDFARFIERASAEPMVEGRSVRVRGVIRNYAPGERYLDLRGERSSGMPGQHQCVGLLINDRLAASLPRRSAKTILGEVVIFDPPSRSEIVYANLKDVSFYPYCQMRAKRMIYIYVTAML